jgi:long-chain acyl-CoA synthetase
MQPAKSIVDYVIEHEQRRGDFVWLTQPLGKSPNGEDALARYTWREAVSQARRMASHLQGLGFAPGARIAMLTKNCAHAMIAELAIWLAGYTTVSIFPTETAKTIRFVLEHSEASLLFVGKLDTWAEQRAALDATLPCIALPLGTSNTRADQSPFPAWDDVITAAAPIDYVPRAADDLAMVIYTSGSTGTPKGVMHSFAGVTRAAEGIATMLREGVGHDVELRMLSYLPLAHVVERAWVQCTSMINGNQALYFAESLDTFVQDLKRARPTAFLSVPRLWLKFQQGVHAKMSASTLAFLLQIPFVKGRIGRKVLSGLGLEHVRMAGSGSAPISAELLKWYRKLGLNLLEGYGMSEDFAYSNSAAIGGSVPNYVGKAMPGVKMKISDEGEILIDSPGKFVGYYKQPELYTESFDREGYFCTGDLGELRADGALKITGRKKELFKTGKGKYVTPAPIENRLNQCPLIESSMVSGVGQQAPYAIVVLNEFVRAKLASNPTAEKPEISVELASLLKQVNAELADYEQLRMLVVSAEPWSIDNGCLTPTLKIKRAQIEQLVTPKLDAWYQNSQAVIWDA